MVNRLSMFVVFPMHVYLFVLYSHSISPVYFIVVFNYFHFHFFFFCDEQTVMPKIKTHKNLDSRTFLGVTSDTNGQFVYIADYYHIWKYYECQVIPYAGSAPSEPGSTGT
jgi:hypothetical protein